MLGERVLQPSVLLDELGSRRDRGDVRGSRDSVGLLRALEEVASLVELGFGSGQGRGLAPLGHGGDGLLAHWARLARDEVRPQCVGAVRVVRGVDRALPIGEELLGPGDESLGAGELVGGRCDLVLDVGDPSRERGKRRVRVARTEQFGGIR